MYAHTDETSIQEVIQEDMFGLLPEHMTGGSTKIQQFMSVFAPEARAIKMKLQLPLNTLTISAGIWTILKVLNAKEKVRVLEAGGNQVEDIELGTQPTPRQEAFYNPPGTATVYEKEQYVLVKSLNGTWTHAVVMEVEDGNVSVAVGTHGIQMLVPAAACSTMLRAQKSSKLGKRMNQLYEDLKKAVDDFESAQGKNVKGFDFYDALEGRAILVKEQKAALDQHQGRAITLLKASIEGLRNDIRREEDQLKKWKNELNGSLRRLEPLREELLHRFDRDNPSTILKRAEYRTLYNEMLYKRAQTTEGRAHIQDLDSLLKEQEGELHRLTGTTSSAPRGGGGGRSSGSSSNASRTSAPVARQRAPTGPKKAKAPKRPLTWQAGKNKKGRTA